MDEIEAPKSYSCSDYVDDMLAILGLLPRTNFNYVGEVLSRRLRPYGRKMLQEGLRAFKARDYNTAVREFGALLELSIALVGAYGPQCSSTYYMYGRALLHKARQEGGKSDEKKEEEPILDHAWKNLLLARELVKKQDQKNSILEVDILEAMGEVSMDREDVRNYINCYENAHLILTHLDEAHTIRLLDIKFRLCLSLMTTFEIEKAVLYSQNAVSICTTRMQSLVKAMTVSMDQTNDDQCQVAFLSPPTNVNRTIELKLLKELLDDLGQIEDLEQVIQSQNSAFIEKLLEKTGCFKYIGRIDRGAIYSNNSQLIQTLNNAKISLKKPALTCVPKEYKKHLQPSANVMIEEGSKAMKVGDYINAERMLSCALKIRTALYGEYATECYSAYYLHGLVMLHKARVVVGKLPNLHMDRSTSESSEAQMLTNSSEHRQGITETYEEIMDRAWKSLTVAWEIVEKQLPKVTLEKVEILEAMGEVSSERENIKISLDLYMKASYLLERLIEPQSLRIAELNFRICLMLVSHSKVKKAISFWDRGIVVCKARLELLSEVTNSTDFNSMPDNINQSNVGQLSGSSKTPPVDQEQLEEIEFLMALLGDLDKLPGNSETPPVDQEQLEEIEFLMALLGDLDKIEDLDQVPENQRIGLLEELLRKIDSSKHVGRFLDPRRPTSVKRRLTTETAQPSGKKPTLM